MSNYRHHLFFEYERVSQLLAKVMHEAEQEEGRSARAEFKVSVLELQLEQAKKFARRCKEAFRKKHRHAMELSQEKGEIEDELFINAEEIEEYWARHQ